jgi:two-component sensor histidine kinase
MESDTDRIGLEVNAQGIKLSIDAAVPCGLLLNELISNCLKHAFRGRDRGRIRVELLPVNGGDILLSVSDDGIGLPGGVEPLSGETFGVQLIADLVDQLHGTLQVNQDAGTTVRIVFPTAEASPVLLKEGTTHERSGHTP